MKKLLFLLIPLLLMGCKEVSLDIVDAKKDVRAFGLVINYDPEKISYMSYRTPLEVPTFMVNETEPGVLKIGAYDTDPFILAGVDTRIVTLRFTEKGDDIGEITVTDMVDDLKGVDYRLTFE